MLRSVNGKPGEGNRGQTGHSPFFQTDVGIDRSRFQENTLRPAAMRAVSDIFCPWLVSLASSWSMFPIMLPSAETPGK
jgi:hypothetical protein